MTGNDKIAEGSMGIRRTKRILRACRRLQREVKNDRLRLARLTARERRAATPSARRLAEQATDEFREAAEKRRRLCSEALSAARGRIAALEDPLLRRIFFLYYIEGMTWQRVAFATGSFSESVPRKKHDRFLAAQAKAESTGEGVSVLTSE